MSTLIDETGNRYGRLLVLERVKNSTKDQAQWRCMCDCGNEIIVPGGRLRSGNTKACGCLWRLPPGGAALNGLIGRTKGRAKRKGIQWKLSKDDVKYLTKMNCHYCGAEPNQVFSGRTLNGSYIYNGIDRVDNDLGYVLGNVVPCCKICNRAKDVMTRREFLSWIKRVWRVSCND